MDYVINSVATVGMGFFVVFALLNLLFFISKLYYGGERHVSMLPFIGGVSGCFGFALIPSLRFYAWLPLLLDVGTVSLIFATPALVRQAWLTSSPNLVSEYVALAENRKARVRLFKKQVFTLKCQFSREPNEIGVTEFSTIGEWFEEDKTLRLEIGKTHIVFKKVHINGKEEMHFVSGLEEHLHSLIFTRKQA